MYPTAKQPRRSTPGCLAARSGASIRRASRTTTRRAGSRIIEAFISSFGTLFPAPARVRPPQ
eukprot:scaffold17379_cov59-Phaeocystis_antarctica.AAC.1